MTDRLSCLYNSSEAKGASLRTWKAWDIQPFIVNSQPRLEHLLLKDSLSHLPLEASALASAHSLG